MASQVQVWASFVATVGRKSINYSVILIINLNEYQGTMGSSMVMVLKHTWKREKEHRQTIA